MTVLVFGMVTAFYLFLMALILALDIPGEDKFCISSQIIGTVVIITFALWVRYWVGRREAEYEQSLRWKDP